VEEYNKMIDKLEESAVQLAQSEREDAWREMAKQIAHEIKNPLTPMRLRVQQLTRIYEADPHQLEERLKSTSASLIEQIESLAQIANEFSAFAKMPDPVNERVELNQLVKSVVNLFEDEENADLYMYLPKDQLVSFVDKKQLVRVLNNLIKNAIQAIPEERRGDIGIHLFQREDKAIIMVEDNGTGIPEDKQDKVFVPNFTTKSSGKGLGLAIARNVVAAAKGKIYFETEKGKGTKFFVELPLMNN
jgi:two-component system nitrogen regulation sensor histidine kinase NtrY